ncbi:ExeM/NucH family extracellular endonuclease [Hymenobacter properus]|uniref:ExeM/NucH family extracellular endonuclease n=1 Tax=Hymenobacter properus TaxID=2791026 RepID=A0A931BI35_9BACT|nr:ExeM/NucH family extracellular endonuclease [Hymenobacter properus]MBF9142682.1 ExeM/NucH family extracellular endonuclease [Hymenobacter properus]MBR7721490.1 ExeM/NucH family extracellular endonuclease [Microvirga sp. SRT04]
MLGKLLLSTGFILGAGAAGATPIGAIQGSGAAAKPGTYTIEAVVTGVYAGLNPAGFYVQDETATADGNPATSDALFVVAPNPTVKIGDKVRISGVVREDAGAPSFNQAILTEPSIEVLASGQALPAFVTIDNTTFSAANAERYEGMRVQFSAPMTVTDNYSLKQRGELTVSAQGLTYQPTQFIDPNDDPATGTHSSGTSNVAAVNAYQKANEDKSLVLDDGSSANNPSPTPYLDPNTGTVRIGSTLTGLRGIMGYGYGKWRVQPLPGEAAPVVRTSRPKGPPVFSTLDLKLASFNVLNYFNGDGVGGGFPTPRGAKTPEDFARQRAKIILAISQMNADVVGLTEIENDGNGSTSAIQDLVDGLNKVMGAGTYIFVNDGDANHQPNNTDLIHCAILYKPAVVAPMGPPLLFTTPDVFERPPLAQIFITKRKERPDTLGFVINHFKSKGSGKGADADQNDGQGGSNARRKLQAAALVQFINKTVIPAGAARVVSAGDYNANYEEDPMDIMRAAGLVPATPPTSASYVFKGLTGSLDHAVITNNLVGFIDVQKWHINSAEPSVLEYSNAGAATDINTPFRSSDHDPVLIGVNFSGMTNANTSRPTSRLFVYPNPPAGQVPFSLADVPARVGRLTLDFSLPQGTPMLSLQGTPAALQSQLREYTAHLAPGIYVLKLSGTGYQQTRRVMKE